MKEYLITQQFIYAVKDIINWLFNNDEVAIYIENLIKEVFEKYFKNISTNFSLHDRMIEINIHDLFSTNEKGETRVDGQDYIRALDSIESAHSDIMNNFLNVYKRLICTELRHKYNKGYADLFSEIIPVIATKISIMFGMPAFRGTGMAVCMRLY